MDADEEVQWIGLVEDRIAFLERLADDPAHKPRLEEDLECSRSTIDRAIRRLEAADLVERTGDGYVATVTGQLAADRYRAYAAAQRTLDAARPVLEALPAASTVPSELLAGGTAAPAEGEPHRAFERVARHLRAADRYRVLLPALTDSRHLRLLHARVVADDLDATVVVSDGLADRLREEFPRLVADLVDADSCRLRRGEVPAYGLAVAETEDAASVVLTAAENGHLAGTVENDAAAAVRRAREVCAATDERADTVAAPSPDPGDHGTPLSADGIHARQALADAGMARLDRSYFTERTPGDPARAWRLGFDLVDVYYGYAVERAGPAHDSGPATADGNESGLRDGDIGLRDGAVSHDDAVSPDGDPTASATDAPGAAESGRALSGALADRLADGEDTLVVGPPGAGKSTVCRAVACRWVEAGHGPVFYRESPASGEADFSALPDVLGADDGHALVVVEDAADVAGPFLELLRSVADDPGVSVLGEARERGWHGAVDEVTDPRRREAARTELATERVPTVDERTCVRAVAAFEAATGRDVPLSPAALHERVENEGGLGEMHVLSYQVVAHTVETPWLDDPVGPSVLDGDVRATYRALAPSDESDDETLPLEVGLLVATLTAAERTVVPGLVHAVAAARADGERADRAHRRVEAVVDDIDGRMLVKRADATAYRTQHPRWATRFLEHALDHAERETVALFERAVNALFSLADDAERRRHVEAWLGRESDAVRRFARTETVDEFVEALFRLGFTRSELAPLFGTSEHSGIELPETCSPRADLEARSCRGKMWYDHGNAERAERELSTLCDRAATASAPESTRTQYLAEGYRGLAEVVVDGGETERARDALAESLDAARAGDHPRKEVGALNSLAWVAMTVDEYDRAEDRLDDALAIAEELGPCGDHSDVLYYRARLEHYRGDLAAAEEWLRRTVEMDREVGNDQNQSSSLKLLGDVAKERGADERAAEYYRRSLERKRLVRDRQGTARTLADYAELQHRRGAVDRAEAALERSMELARNNGMDRLEGRVAHEFGRLALDRGALDAATERFRDQRLVHADCDHERGVAAAAAGLGDVARERGRHDDAVERYRDSVERYREVGLPREAADVIDRLVTVCRTAGDEADALEWCETGVEVCADGDLDDRRARFAERRETLTAQVESDD